MRFRTPLAAALALPLFLAGTAACSSDGDSATPSSEGGAVTLDFWYSVSGKPADALVALVEEFNSSHEDITVNAVFQGKYADTMSKLTNAVQSGDIPILLQGGDTFSAYLRDTGLAASPAEVEDRAGDAFDPASLVPAVADYYTFDGVLSSVPVMASQPIVFYNTELLEQAGIDPAVAPASVMELLERAEKIHAATGTPGITFQLNEWWAEVFSAAEGIAYCTPDNGIGAERASAFSYTSDTQVEIWTKVQELLASGAMFNVGTDGDAAQNTFATAKSAMILASTGTLGNISAAAGFDVSAWALPTSSTGGAVPGGSSVWILDEGFSDSEVSAAASFVAFLASPGSQSTIFTETGFLPSSQEALDTLSTTVDGPQAVMLDQLAASGSTKEALGCHTGAMGEARPAVRTALEEIANGADVKTSLTKAQELGTKAITSYNERL